jgi:hypothetical protein
MTFIQEQFSANVVHWVSLHTWMIEGGRDGHVDDICINLVQQRYVKAIQSFSRVPAIGHNIVRRIS